MDCRNPLSALQTWRQLQAKGGKNVSAGPDIVGIGVCTVDHLVTVPRLPHRNENMRALTYSRQLGGLASIALIAAARLGARSKIIARIGEDENGAYIRNVLQEEGLDVSQLLMEPGSESHVSVILVDEPSGDRSIITRPPTGRPISLAEIRREAITSARVLFVDDLNDATLQAARWAREAGMKVLLDPGRSLCRNQSASRFCRCADCARLLGGKPDARGASGLGRPAAL